MSTFNSLERAAIDALVQTTIGTSCPLFFQNSRKTQSDDTVVWARFTLQQVNTRYASIGITPQTRMRRTIGFLNLQIFVPENGDVQPGLDIADIYVTGVDSQILTITGGQIRIGVTSVIRDEDHAKLSRSDSGLLQILCVTDYERDVFG